MSVVAERSTLPPGYEQVAREPAQRPLGWWGMVMFITTEATLFGLVIFAYFFVRSQAQLWPPPGIPKPELGLSGIRTVILLASSVPIHIAYRGIRRGAGRTLLAGLAATWVLGAVFLAGHFSEYTRLSFRWTTNAYGSLFYTITMFHALHLVVGLAMITAVFVRARLGRYDQDHHLGVELTTMYWHFVDVVWIVVYASLYLSVRWT